MSHTMTNLHWFAVGPKTQLRQWPMGTRPKPLAAHLARTIKFIVCNVHYIYALYVILQWQYMGASIAFPAGEWVISVRIKNSKTTMRPNIFSKPVKLASLVTLIHVIVLVNWSIVIASELCPAVKGTNLDQIMPPSLSLLVVLLGNLYTGPRFW